MSDPNRPPAGTSLKQASHQLSLLTAAVTALSDLVDPAFADASLPALQEKALAYSNALRTFDTWLSANANNKQTNIDES